jgi:tetratricopeptide (TPR) repeat protein
MTLGLRRRMTGLVLALVPALPWVLAPVSARAQDLNEIYKQFEQQRLAGNYAEAERLGIQAADVCASRFGRDDIRCAWTLNNLALVYWRQGKNAEAEKLFRRALAIRETKLGNDHLDVAQTLNDLALVYWRQRKYAEAEKLFRRALAIRETKLGSDHLDVARSLSGLALAYARQRKYAEAEVALGAALALMGDLDTGIAHMRHGIKLSPRDRRLGFWGWALGSFLLRANRVEEALEEARVAARRDPRLYLPPILEAVAQATLGRTELARAALVSARRIRPKLTEREIRSSHGRHAARILSGVWDAGE